MSLITQRQGQLGVNVVERIVLATWNARWQPLEAHNDDGIDGLIFLEKGGELTGQIVFVQVKCIRTKKRADGKLAIPIDASKLAKNLEAWRRVVGAAIVVLVDPDDLVARWVDIRLCNARTSAQILVPDGQIFDESAKAELSALCGTLHQDLQALKVHTFADDFRHLRSSDHVQISSRSTYRSLQRTPTKLGVNGEQVHFDREGWRHMTRRGRSELSKYQSFVLLGAARKIIENYSLALNDLPKNTGNDGNARFFQ